MLMNHSDDFLNIDTPENVIFGYEIAGLGSRFLAALIDTSLIVVLQVVVQVVLVFVIDVAGEIAGSIIAGAAILVGFALLWGYYIYFEITWNGQTPGKRRVGLRTIRADGTPAAASEMVIRNLVRIVDFLPVGYGVGIVVMFIHPQARRLGDLAAGTLVVYDRTELSLENVARGAQRLATPRGRIPPELALLPFERLAESDLALLEDYLQRQDGLANAIALGRTLLARTYERLESTPPAGPPALELTRHLQALYYLARHPAQREELIRQLAPPPPLTPPQPAPPPDQLITPTMVARLGPGDLMRVDKFLAQRYTLSSVDQVAAELLDDLFGRMAAERPTQSYREMVAALERIAALGRPPARDGDLESGLA
jgi:uncharacterized RDD family membrane protein YckC